MANHAIIRSSSPWQPTPQLVWNKLHITTAFLNGVLTKDLYCRLPPLTTCRMLNYLFASSKPPTAPLKMGLTNDDSDQGLFILPSATSLGCNFFILCFSQSLLNKCKTSIRINGMVERYKARFIVNGFMQRPKVDFSDVYAPVSSKAGYRVLLSAIISKHVCQAA